MQTDLTALPQASARQIWEGLAATVADAMQCSSHLEVASEAVQLDLCHGGAKGEVVERLVAAEPACKQVHQLWDRVSLIGIAGIACAARRKGRPPLGAKADKWMELWRDGVRTQ